MDLLQLTHRDLAGKGWKLPRAEQIRLATLWQRCRTMRLEREQRGLPTVRGTWHCPIHDRLVRSLVPLAFNEARKYAGKYNLLADLSELESCAIHGLLASLEKFDPAKGFAPSTFATNGMRYKLHEYACRDRHLIRVPDKAWTGTFADAAHAARNFSGDSAMLDAIASPLDSRISHEEAAAERIAQDRTIAQALACLTDRERQIVVARFSGKTLKEVGETLGICKERVRQIEKAARQKARLPIGAVGRKARVAKKRHRRNEG